MPINPEASSAKKDRLKEEIVINSEPISQVGLTVVLATVFTIMGTPLITLGLIIGIALAFSFGWWH